MNYNYDTHLKNILDSERSDECIDFTMIITSRNNAPILNYGGGFPCKSEYPWCIIVVKSKHFPTLRNLHFDSKKIKIKLKNLLICKYKMMLILILFSEKYKIPTFLIIAKNNLYFIG
ncbi:Uncharacterized protein FWK35_00000180 [Aphis craccivora]|uniref:Uncharacterized protein n=1 Tax=Aphis craccivora TaxID=307492 RepID=A0A6G0ZPT9_APHCR|nr:Uncharacterized protein FWK35_00000180 [Aphis craccivora]